MEVPKTSDLLESFLSVRKKTEFLCQNLEIEDYGLQTADFVSPPKWHLAHTSWFFETFFLSRDKDYVPLHPQYAVLFNSYYESVGRFHPRPKRGELSRPTVKEVYAYRNHVTELVSSKLEANPEWNSICELGLHHEQQHQELLLMDILYNFSRNPLHPSYGSPKDRHAPPPQLQFHSLPQGIGEIGHSGSGFCFDNETPKHRVFLERGSLANRLVTVGEYLEFMRDEGYGRPELWLSDGWDMIQREGWTSPLYWELLDGKWYTLSLSGFHPIEENAPVTHLSYFEADAYCRWKGWRLPTEQEWEIAAKENLIPQSSGWWEWTRSPYAPYPNFRPLSGSLGEYNGKFMCNQFVLRGSSFATPDSHRRLTYRNFFPPQSRWQFCSLRPARDE